MSSKQNINKHNLRERVELSGVILAIPCLRCSQQNKKCIKSEISKRCSECIRDGRCKCVEMASSDLAWKKLLAAQQKLDEDREATLAKLLRLEKQRKLLQKRAGQFIQTDIKDVEELERLEEEEERKAAEERAKQEAARKEQELIASMLNSGDANGLVVDDSSWLAAFSSPNQLSLDTPESCRGNSNS
jgi:hypothetical protein